MTEQLPEWAVEFYTDAQGKSAAEEFLDRLPDQERARVRNVLRLLREFGALLQMPHARPMTGHRKLWELRAGAIRLLYFAYTGQRMIVLHAFRKKSGKTPAQEIATAERRMSEFLEREE
jgi:phage-related protein